MSKPCQLRVLSSGKYCCEVDQFEVYDNCIGQLKFANLPEVLIEYEITPDTWIPASPTSIVGSGCVDLFKPGTYRFDLDCEALDGTLAPEDAPMSLCYECCVVDDYGPILSAQLEALCEKLLASDDTAANVEIINLLIGLCTKLETLIENMGDLSELCTKLEAVIASLEALCDKIEAGFESIESELVEINSTLEEILTAVGLICEKLDTLHEDNVLICEKLDAANASLEALCDKLDEILAAVIAATASIALLKECNTAENEALCTKLESVQSTLDSVICPKPPCAAEGTAPVTYTNIDEATEMTVSVGVEGDVKIGSGGGDGSEAEITQYITNCLAAGNDVQWEAIGVEGESASGTMLSEAETNPFPGFYNDSVNAAPAISFKVATMTATCLETVEEAGVTLKTYDQCTAEQIAALCEKLDGPKPTIEECCTGGATETTAKCANISASWTSMSLGDFDTCTASFGGIDLPNDNYEYADFEALILSVGGTIEPNPNNPDQYTICVPDGFSTCYSRACFKDRIGQLTRACVVSLPNTTEPDCTDFQRTWGKYEEPIANILETSLDALQSICEKMELQTAKLCVIEQNSNPAAACSKPVEGLDKEALTLTLAGDVVVNYAEGQSIDLQNANAESCGSATSAGGATYDAANDVTVIPIVECELDEGKEPAVIALAQPVKAVTAVAIKTIKTLTAIKTLTPVKSVTEFTGTTFKSEAGAFAVGDVVQLMSAEREVLGTATIAKVSEIDYAISESTVAEADTRRVALAQKVTK